MNLMPRHGAPVAAFLAGFLLWQSDAFPAALQAADPPGEPCLSRQEPGRRGQGAEKPDSAAEQVVRIGAEFWFVKIRGNLESDVSGIMDSKFTLTGDAGIDDGLLPKIFIDYSPNSEFLFRFSVSWLDDSGSATLEEQVDFDGTAFPEGSRVSSEFQATRFGVEMRNPARLTAEDGIQLQSVASFNWLDARCELSGPNGKGSQDYLIETFDYGFETRVALGEGVYLGGDLIFSLGFFDGFYGAETCLKGGYVSKRVVVEAGYRWWSVAGAVNDEPDLDLHLLGPFLTAVVRF